MESIASSCGRRAAMCALCARCAALDFAKPTCRLPRYRKAAFAARRLYRRSAAVPHPPVPRADNGARSGTHLCFLDSEFTSLLTPELISIGAVATDSTAFYAEVKGWNRERSSEFVKEIVMPLLDGDATSASMAAEAFTAWLDERAGRAPTTIISDSGYDRWALTELLGQEDLPTGNDWKRVPISYEELDDATKQVNLRRHHALDDAGRCGRWLMHSG